MIEELKDLLEKLSPISWNDFAKAIAVLGTTIVWNKQKRLECSIEFDGGYFICILRMDEVTKSYFEDFNKRKGMFGIDTSEG